MVDHLVDCGDHALEHFLNMPTGTSALVPVGMFRKCKTGDARRDSRLF